MLLVRKQENMQGIQPTQHVQNIKQSSVHEGFPLRTRSKLNRNRSAIQNPKVICTFVSKFKIYLTAKSETNNTVHYDKLFSLTNLIVSILL